MFNSKVDFGFHQDEKKPTTKDLLKLFHPFADFVPQENQINGTEAYVKPFELILN